jgi:hypothetical protein
MEREIQAQRAADKGGQLAPHGAPVFIDGCPGFARGDAAFWADLSLVGVLLLPTPRLILWPACLVFVLSLEYYRTLDVTLAALRKPCR